MSTPVLPEYVAPYKPVPQITPFTYRDGVTMIKKLELLTKYINKTVVPWINENYTELADAFEAEVNKLITEVNNALAAQIVIVDEKLEQQDIEVDQKINTLEQYVNDQVAAIIGSSITAQDPVVAGIMGNAGSDTRGVTDTLYANKSVETTVTEIQSDITTIEGEFANYLPKERGDDVVPTIAKFPTQNPYTTQDVSIPTRNFTVFDSTHEWWCEPILTGGKRTTYGAGYASNGEVIAWDRSDRDGLSSFIIDDAGTSGAGGIIDDHNAPARWISDDEKFSILMWNTHSSTNSLYVRVSLDGTARGFTDNDTVEIVYTTFPSYNQIFLQSVNGDNYRFLILCRAGAKWIVRYITVNRVTGVVIATEPEFDFITIGNQQAYCIGVLDGRLIRIASYVNPSFDTHAIWVLTLHIDSGAITNPMDSTFAHDLSDGILELSPLTPIVPEIGTTSSRRLYYHHPTQTRVLYSEWARGAENDAIYKEAILDDGDVFIRNLGVAGPRNGYTAGSNYNPGMCYDKSGDYVISAHNLTDGTGEIHVHDTARSWVTRRTAYPVSRPISPKAGQYAYLAVDSYVNYFDFLTHQVAQVGFPVIEQLPVDPSAQHELVVNGTIYLVDSSFSSWRFPSWPSGIPSVVTNLADGDDIIINNQVTGGIVERTGKGALHVAPPRNANAVMFLAMQSEKLYNYAVENTGHRFFIASSARVTRNATAANSNGATSRWLGWIGTSGTERGSIHSANSDMTVMGAYQEGGVPTNRQVGTNLVATGVQLIAGEVVWSLPIGSSQALSMFHGMNAAGAGSSHIQYFDYIEDLDVSGRTYAQALAAVQAYHNKIHGAGGVFANDTWTIPTV